MLGVVVVAVLGKRLAGAAEDVVGILGKSPGAEGAAVLGVPVLGNMGLADVAEGGF